MVVDDSSAGSVLLTYYLCDAICFFSSKFGVNGVSVDGVCLLVLIGYFGVDV